MKIDFSLIQYIPTTIPPLLFPAPSTSLLFRHTPPPPPFRKEQAPNRQQSNMTHQNIVRQGKIPHDEARQGNPTGRKESQE